MPRFILISILLSFAGSAGIAQTLCQAAMGEITKLRALSGQPVSAKPAARNEYLNSLTEIGQMTNCLVMMAAKPIQLQDLIKRLEQTRNDQQEGSNAGTGGSTTLVSKGPAAEVISVATEYGALTQSISNQTVTVKGNLANLPYALVNQSILPSCALNIPYLPSCAPNGYLEFLSRFSFGVTFDTSRNGQNLTANTTGPATNPQPITLQAQRQQISAITGRVEIVNHRNVTSQAFLDGFKKAVAGRLGDADHNMKIAAETLRDAIRSDLRYAQWQTQALAALNNSSDVDLTVVWQTQMQALIQMMAADLKNFDDLVATANQAYGAFFSALKQTIEVLSKSSAVAVEYTNNRPLAQPATSNFRLIIDVPFWRKWKIIGNGAVTIYDTLPITTPGVRRLRDIQGAAELSYSFGTNAITGPAALSLAGYYQDQRSLNVLNVDPNNPILGVTFVGLSPNASTVLAQIGPIKLVQLKLTLGGASAVKIPLAVSYSDRTDLLNKPTWRAQVGITYNLDSLFTK